LEVGPEIDERVALKEFGRRMDARGRMDGMQALIMAVETVGVRVSLILWAEEEALGFV
jgi:hypothetical protein